LRVVRICSEPDERMKALCLLYEKFAMREYTADILQPTLSKLIGTCRKEALRPKKNLLCKYLSIHNPNILSYYNIPMTADRYTHVNHNHNTDALYAVFPFYKSVYQYKQVLQTTILDHVKNNCAPKYRVFVEDLCVKIVFSRTKNLKEEIKV